jgi:hypothetical protein
VVVRVGDAHVAYLLVAPAGAEPGAAAHESADLRAVRFDALVAPVAAAVRLALSADALARAPTVADPHRLPADPFAPAAAATGEGVQDSMRPTAPPEPSRNAPAGAPR